MDEKGVTFTNKNLGTNEFFTIRELESRTFDELATDLWNRLRLRNRDGFRSDRTHESQAPERQPVKFSWRKPSGEFGLITGATNVLSFIHETGAREIFYFADTIGGVEAVRHNSGQSPDAECFVQHAQKILHNPRDFGRWELTQLPGIMPRLEKRILDKYKRVISVFIQPDAALRYPDRPPRVVTRPPLQDNCFSHSTGELMWAGADGGRVPVWSEYKDFDNPLGQLIDELRRKYFIL